MPISREDYKNILKLEEEEKLSIRIDLSTWRQKLYRVDIKEFSDLLKTPVKKSIIIIRILSVIWFPLLFISAILTIPAFHLWALIVAPTTLMGCCFYKSSASFGVQKGKLVYYIFLFAILFSFFGSAINIWIRFFFVFTAATLFFTRYLYIFTTMVVFACIQNSYEFFAAFYLQPEDAMVPLIFTIPEYVSSEKV